MCILSYFKNRAQGQVGYVPSNYVKREAQQAKNGDNGLLDRMKGALTPRNGSKDSVS